MKPSRIMELIGGAVGAVAFFLPWFSYSVISFSLYDIVRLSDATSQIGSGSNNSNPYVFGWLDPIAGVALLVFALLAVKMGKSAHTLGLISSLAGLGVVIYYFVKLQGDLNGSTSVSITSILGIGFWIAGVAFIIGLIGAIKGLSEAPPVPVLTYTPTSSNWPNQSPPPYQGD